MSEFLSNILKAAGYSITPIALIAIFWKKISKITIDLIAKRIDIKMSEESNRRLTIFKSELDQINNQRNLILNNVMLRTNGVLSERVIKAVEDYWVQLVEISQHFGSLVAFYKKFSDEELKTYYQIINITSYTDSIKGDLDKFILSNAFSDQRIDRQVIFLSDSLTEKYFIFVIFLTQASIHINQNIKSILDKDKKPIVWHDNQAILPSLFKFFDSDQVVYDLIDKCGNSFDAVFYQMKEVIKSELIDLMNGKNQISDSLKTADDAYKSYEEYKKFNNLSSL